METFNCSIKTLNGTFVTAVNGGGLGGSDAGSGLVALHTDATAASAWETFCIIMQGGNVFDIVNGAPFALQTSGGHFITANEGGGIGGANDASCPIHTDARSASAWETFTFMVDASVNPPTARIQTSSGRYVTAVNGGDVGASFSSPVRSDATEASAWETFKLVNVTASGIGAVAYLSFQLDSFEILNTRSGNIFGTSSDTDYASMSVTVGHNAPVTQVQSMGDLRKGNYFTNIRIPNLAVRADDNVVVTYHVLNSSKGEQSASAYLQQTAESLAQAAVKALATTAGAGLGAAIGTFLVLRFQCLFWAALWAHLPAGCSQTPGT